MARKIDTTSKFLSSEEIKELANCVKDPLYFSNFVNVVHPVRGKVRFELYPYQRSVLYQFLKNRFNIILKFRQAGITELISLYCLWLAMYHPNKKINIISIKDTVAKKVLKKIKYMYKNLPFHLQTPIVNGRSGEYGCVTEDTVLIGQYNNFAIGDITPKTRGIIDISHLNIKVLTHKGTFEKVLKAFNKGTKLTYTVKNDRGKILRGSSRHALYTTSGWKFLPDIIENDLDVIFWDASYLDEAINPQVELPIEKVVKETNYQGYWVSNLGDVYSTKFLKRSAPGELIQLCPRKSRNHYRVKLTLNGKKKQVSVHRLVWETFNGPIPGDKVIDHIDCDVSNNSITNLQCISPAENTKRGKKYNRSWISWNYKFSNLSLLQVGQLKARIASISNKGNYGYGVGSIIADEFNITTKDVSRYKRGLSYRHIYTSKIQLLDITKETIVDIEVENANSYITDSNYINHNTAEEVEFSNGSFIASIPTTEDAGRSEGLSLLVIDEAAIIRWASAIWASSFPTLSCVIRRTKILVRETKGKDKGKAKYIKIGDISPKSGQLDIRELGLEAFTHNGNWKPITHSVYKGKIETWKIVDEYGNQLDATPAHRLLTPYGWKTVKEVINNNLQILRLNFHDPVEPTKTVPPSKEVIKPILGFDGYYVSNLGKVYRMKRQGLKEMTQRLNKDGYFRVGLRNGEKRETGSLSNQGKSKIYQKSVSRLVAEAFIGDIPDGFQVDHINCVRTDNYSTNLQIISVSDNVGKSFSHSLNANIGTQTGKKMPNLEVVGRIIEELSNGNTSSVSIANKLSVELNLKLSSKFVSKCKNKLKKNKIQLTSLTLKKVYLADIVDIHVEDDHSYITKNGWVNHNTGGAAIINSTPFGTGGFYHSTWVDAITGKGPVNPLRLYWNMHPERDQKWYDEMSKVLGPKRTAQEIDGDFLSSGNTVFDISDIKAIEDMLSEYPPLVTRFNGQYKQFSLPDKDKEYFIGADCSTGRATDYSSFTIMDKPGEEHAVFKGRIPLNKYGKLLGDVGERFNFATLAPETNDIGMAVTLYLQDEGYPNLYYHKKILKKKGKKRPETEDIPGWLTTSKNRSLIIENLEKDVREGVITVKDPFFCQEAYTFVYDGSGRPVAMGKHNKASSVDIDLEGETYSDDSILGKAITNHVRKTTERIVTTSPQ